MALLDDNQIAFLDHVAPGAQAAAPDGDSPDDGTLPDDKDTPEISQGDPGSPGGDDATNVQPSPPVQVSEEEPEPPADVATPPEDQQVPETEEEVLPAEAEGQSSQGEALSTWKEDEATGKAEQSTGDEALSPGDDGASGDGASRSPENEGEAGDNAGPRVEEVLPAAMDRGESSEEERQSTEVEGQSEEDVGQSPEDEGQSTEVEGQSTEDEGQSPGDEGESTGETGGQSTEQEEGEPAGDEGQSEEDVGQSTEDEGESTGEAGGQSTEQEEGEPAGDEGQSEEDVGQSTEDEGESAGAEDGQSTEQEEGEPAGDEEQSAEDVEGQSEEDVDGQSAEDVDGQSTEDVDGQSTEEDQQSLEPLFEADASVSSAPAPARAAQSGDTRPSEFIAGASGTQYSYGENTDQATKGGKDFEQGSRDAAGANQHDPKFSADPSNPMQSPNLGQGSFALRYAIGFLCANYPAGWNNLSDVAGYSKPNSAFLKSFAGMNQSQQYTDPAKAAILQQVDAWIASLAKALPADGQGELVITFQGHGAHGSFFASDGQELKTSELLAKAKSAEALRVSLTIVMDACFSGGSVPAFQDHAADSVDSRVNQNVEGAGQMSSESNHARAEKLRDEMASARELILCSQAVAAEGDTLNALNQGFSAGSAAYWQSVTRENTKLYSLVRSMQDQFTANMPFDHAPQVLHDNVKNALAAIVGYLANFNPSTKKDIDQWMNALGSFQDQLSDNANRIIEALQEASKAG